MGRDHLMGDLFDDQPDPENWSFDKIRLSESKRTDALEKAPKFLEIPDTIVGAAARAVRAGSDTYFWASEPHNSWWHFKRAVFQFPVEADQFDFFWNARTGFRAQFWLNPEIGARANALMTRQVTAVAGGAANGTRWRHSVRFWNVEVLVCGNH
jgi:hypothetical protein